MLWNKIKRLIALNHMIGASDEELGSLIRKALRRRNQANSSLEDKYNLTFNMLASERLDFLRLWLLNQVDSVIQSGPFAGMVYHSQKVEGCYIPKLLGIYESELHSVIEGRRRIPYDRIINVGCAEGYYAIGLARYFPNTQVFAFDINEQAQESCQQLAEINQVSERVTIGGLVAPEDWSKLIQGNTLVFCDIEGAEF
jgi:2-polyprenyl-3-methyl-5-hydroxy-6-metoxy-1,4-benzoquinol methylase